MRGSLDAKPEPFQGDEGTFSILELTDTFVVLFCDGDEVMTPYLAAMDMGSRICTLPTCFFRRCSNGSLALPRRT